MSHLPATLPRPRREFLPRFVPHGEFDTLLRGALYRLHECDGPDYASSCRAVRRRARTPKCAGRITEPASVFEVNPIDGFGSRVENKPQFILALAYRFVIQ